MEETMRMQLQSGIRAMLVHPIKSRVLQRFETDLKSGRLTTPRRTTANLLDFCKALSPDHKPDHVDVVPQPWSRMDCCDLNVRKMVADEGGIAVMGYKIWGLDDYYFEAVPHVVWENPSTCKLEDITFNEDGELRILFVSDPRLQSVRQNTMGDKRRGVYDVVLKEFWSLKSPIEQEIMLKRPGDEELWNKSLTYNVWKKRHRRKA